MKKAGYLRAAAIAMALAALLGVLAGCGKKSGGSGGGNPARDQIAGVWEATLDSDAVAEAVFAMISSDDPSVLETLRGIDFSGVSVKLTAQFGEDMTYAVQVDDASAENAVDQVVARLLPVIRDMVRAELADRRGVSPEEVTDEQVDGMLPLMGVRSWDELGDTLLDNKNTDRLFRRYRSAGTYMVGDGTLYYAARGEVSESSPAARYEISGGTLRFLPAADGELPAFLNGLAFRRAG